MNLLLIIIGVVLIWRVVEGFKIGMVREIISLISLLVMSVSVVLIAVALGSYMDKDIISMLVAIVLFLILCIVHRLVSVVFFSAKVVSKLPVVHGIDRVLGGVVGACETVIITWVIFSLVMVFGLGMLGEQIMLYIKESQILSFLYENNYLAYGVNILSEKISLLPIDFENVSNTTDSVKNILGNVLH